MSPALDEPSIPPRLRRPLAAIWISLGLHAAVIALVQVAPPASTGAGTVIEARLVPTHAEAAPPMTSVEPEHSESEAASLSPVEAVDALPLVASADTAPAPEPATALPAPAASEPVAPPVSAGISLPVDLTYYGARELDVQPRALGRIEPVYPDDAARRLLPGRVRLQLKLEADGRVNDVEVVEAEPPGVFEESAVRAFRSARFEPGQKDGRAVRALLLIEVEYDWDDRR